MKLFSLSGSPIIQVFGSIRRSSHNFNGNPLSKALNMWVVGDSQFVANISYISETVQDDPMFTMDHDH